MFVCNLFQLRRSSLLYCLSMRLSITFSLLFFRIPTLCTRVYGHLKKMCTPDHYILENVLINKSMSTNNKNKENQPAEDFNNDSPNWPVLIPIIVIMAGLILFAIFF